MTIASTTEAAATSQRIVINCCFGGFGLSEHAYEKLIEWGVPVKQYKEQQRDPNTGLFLPEPANDGEVIFDRDLSEQTTDVAKFMRRLGGRYWDSWIGEKRTHPLLIRVIDELGEAASGRRAELKVVEVPPNVEWEIDEYDGIEHVAEVHRTWR